ncbi:hypothetical protein GCM10023116_13300 [Kistimonas scapharcae]|uniref:DUF7673 domain-containing protein n=1 Tax=Kistimonas scapharcae TaxID=1036133 RepID=A0ABP8V1E5_9GAMM
MVFKQTPTVQEYAQSVAELLSLAKQHCGGSRVAAQVLLSAYNGEEWQLNVADLCVLDMDNLTHALKVMTGRAIYRREPQELVVDGDNHFQALVQDWKRFHIHNRWKTTCFNCDGSGVDYEDDEGEIEITCMSCHGKGVIAEVREF